jgi:hypothetical protein
MEFKLYLPTSTFLLIAVMAYCIIANSQADSGTYVLHPNQEVRVASLPSTVAASTSGSAVLTASVATAVLERDLCCDQNSALENQISSAKGLSLKELGEKLRGKAYLNDGSQVLVADRYWSGASVSPQDIIGSLMAQRPLLMDWNSHLYVLYGAVFDEYRYQSGTVHAIHTLLLIDTRFSDRRRYVSFNRQTDDWEKVTGLLALAITRNK